MKKTSVYIAIIGILFIGSGTCYALTSSSSPSSSVSSGGTGASIDVGVPGYPDSMWASSDLETVVSTTTPWTILSFAALDETNGVDNFTCDGGTTFLPIQSMNAYSFSAGFGLPIEMSMFGPWHCTGSLQNALAGTYAVVQYVPYDTRVVSSSTASLSDVSFALAIIIVILFLMVIGFMYNNMTHKKPWS